MSENFDHEQLRVKALELAIVYWQGREADVLDVVDTASNFFKFLTKCEQLA